MSIWLLYGNKMFFIIWGHMTRFLLMLISIAVAQPIKIDLMRFNIFSEVEKNHQNEIYLHILEMQPAGDLKEYLAPQPPFYIRADKIISPKGLNLCSTSLEESQGNSYVISFLERSTFPSEIDNLLGAVLLKLRLMNNKIESEVELISSLAGQNLVVEGNTAQVDLPHEPSHYQFNLSWSVSE